MRANPAGRGAWIALTVPTAMPDRTALAYTRAIVDLGAIRANARLLREKAAPARLIAVVKADAYGHGAARVARTLEADGVDHFAVATLPEAIALREAGIAADLVVFGAPLPEFWSAFPKYRLAATIASRENAAAAIRAAREAGPLVVHLNVDTGMGRLGVLPGEAIEVARMLRGAPGVTLGGVWTHLATADEPDSLDDAAFAREQHARFAPLAEALGERGVPVHIANSGGLLWYGTESAPMHPTFARVGLALYGYAASAALGEAAGLSPALRLVSRITHVKQVEAGTPISYGATWRAPRRTHIATVACGYADGVPRSLSSRGAFGAVVRGEARMLPIAGRVCMDMTMLDAGPGAPPAVGDEAVVLGAGGPSVYEVAEWAETIPYEICCRIGARVPRVYVGE